MTSFRVVICGFGPVAEATARLLERMDFHVIHAGPNPTAVGRVRLPGVDRRLVCRYSALAERAALGDRDLVVIATRGQDSDLACLRQALASPAAYIGLVSSRSRWAAFRNSLRAEGFLKHDLDRVRCPAGLNIGSVTPDEIGLSIVAQLVQERARQLYGGEE